MRTLTAGLISLLALTSAACSGEPFPTTTAPGPAPTTAHASNQADTESDVDASPRQIGVIARGLTTPWGLAFLPDGTALVSERDTGDVLLVGHGLRPVRVGNLPRAAGGEGGLLGVAVSPGFEKDHRVYFYVTTATDNRVVRMTYAGGELSDPEPILTGIPAGTRHDGGRLEFGPDKYLYVSTGEAGASQLAQKPSSLGGKILRITSSGEPAPGNPKDGSPVWSLGHRNVQGLAWDAGGQLWASEFGDQTWDELNQIVKGDNYGWPIVEGAGKTTGYKNPAVVWRTSEASPSGLAFARGALWLGALRGERLWRVPITDAGPGKPQDFYLGAFGRVRTIERAPDGHLWVTTSNTDGRGTPRTGDDQILELAP